MKFDKELYPRFEADNATINQYRQSIDKLPPILVTKDLTIIDGYHRYVAFKLEQRKEIQVKFSDISDRQQILLKAIEENNAYGKQLTAKEKRKLAQQLWNEGIQDLNRLSEILSVDIHTTRDYTETQRKKQKEERDNEILDLYLQCWSQVEIAEKLSLDQKTIGNALRKNGALSEIPKVDDLEHYNVWHIGSLAVDQLKFIGQTPIEILENLIYYYTKDPTLEPLNVSKVVDPMAGSGVIRDVCIKLKRRYFLMDVSPIRQDIPITQNDILKGFPDKARNADFVFLDPPYYKEKDYPECKFNTSLEDFYEAIEMTLKHSLEMLKDKGFAALMLKPMGSHEKGDFEWLDLTLESYSIITKVGFTLVKRICVPLSTQQYNEVDFDRAKKNRYMLNTLRDILVMQK